MSRIVGIDLGTTNSLVAYADAGKPRVIPLATGRNLLPSVVFFENGGGRVVGDRARSGLAAQPDRTVWSVKRLMGKGGAEAEADALRLPYRVLTDDPKLVRIQVNDEILTPPEISAEILKELRRAAEAFLKEPVTRAVITVPAYFNDSQRQATKDAGRLAGLEVLRIVNEPTAASLAYGLHEKKEGIIAVYDLGGGTFDISILKLRAGIFEVLATNGDTHLGGDDLDHEVARRLVEEIEKARGVQIRDGAALQAFRVAVEKAKCDLSSQETAEVELQLENPKLHVHRTVSREELERWVEPIVDRTLPSVRTALRDAGVDARAVGEVILVGGQTRMPLLRRKVEALFGRKLHTELNPDEVVALGAAVQADILAGERKDLLLLDVIPLSLGIEAFGGTTARVIARNTAIPTRASEMFTTFVDGQTRVDIHVLQGERELAKDNRSLARFELRGISPQPAGVPRIEVTFVVDENGILSVQAKDVRTGLAQEIQVKPSYGLTDGEVEHMLQASIEHAQEDVEARLWIETKNEAETVLRATRKSLAQDAAKSLERQEREEIVRAAAQVEAALLGSDRSLLRAALDQLEQATHHLAEIVMKEALKEAIRKKV